MSVVLHHSVSSGTDKVVLLGIANHEGDGGSWPAVETLARYANCTERSVRYSLRRLVESGELRVIRQGGGTDDTRDDRRPNLYRVLVTCPDDCAGGTSHRPRGETDFRPTANGVKPTSERGEAGFRDGVKPTSAEPSLEPSGKPLAAAPQNTLRKRDELFEAIASACDIRLDAMTKTERGQLNRAKKELGEVGATTDQVLAAARAWKARYPNATLTPGALMKHWSSLSGPATPSQFPAGSGGIYL